MRENRRGLYRQSDVEAPDWGWVSDITCIRTQEGSACLAPRHGLSDQWRSHGPIIDLCSRPVVGWSMQSRQRTDAVLQALLMAVWRRKPKNELLIHSDEGRQFTGMDWAALSRSPTILSIR